MKELLMSMPGFTAEQSLVPSNESGGEPAILTACTAVGVAFYPLLTEVCKNPQARSQGQIISQVCG
jgi:hypothetical protein